MHWNTACVTVVVLFAVLCTVEVSGYSYYYSCNSHFDLMGKYHLSFNCKTYGTFCCKTQYYPYSRSCCSTSARRCESCGKKIYTNDIHASPLWPIIVGSVVGGVAFFVIIVAIVCCAAKTGHRSGRVIDPNTTTVVNTGQPMTMATTTTYTNTAYMGGYRPPVQTFMAAPPPYQQRPTQAYGYAAQPGVSVITQQRAAPINQTTVSTTLGPAAQPVPSSTQLYGLQQQQQQQQQQQPQQQQPQQQQPQQQKY